jgi:hypothetical protein
MTNWREALQDMRSPGHGTVLAHTVKPVQMEAEDDRDRVRRGGPRQSLPRPG